MSNTKPSVNPSPSDALAASILAAMGGGGGGGSYALGPIPGLRGNHTGSSITKVLDSLSGSNEAGNLRAVFSWLTNSNASYYSTGQMLGTIRTAWESKLGGGGDPQLFDANRSGGWWAYGLNSNANPTRATKASKSNTPPNVASLDPNALGGGGGGLVGTSTMSALSEQSAYATVTTSLNDWNLMGLADQAWNMISDPGFHLDGNEVLQWVRTTPEYQKRFPGMAEINKIGYHMSESDYIRHEQDVYDQFANYNLPANFLNPQEMGTLVARGIYGANLTNRLSKGYDMAVNSDPQVRNLLHKWYGVDTGHLLAYYLSPKHGMDAIVKNTQSALIGNEAYQTGFKGLDKKTAGELSAQMTNSNYNMDYFRTGFEKAAGLQPLETQQIGQRGQATASKGQILAQEFTGLNKTEKTDPAQNAQAIDLATQAKTAGLRGGGGFVSGATGAVGVGRAGTVGNQTGTRG